MLTDHLIINLLIILAVAWPVGGGVFKEKYHYVGVSSYFVQHAVGDNEPVNTAFWTATAAVIPLKGAVCCK